MSLNVTVLLLSRKCDTGAARSWSSNCGETAAMNDRPFAPLISALAERAALTMLLAAMAATVSLWFACSLSYPFGWDQGVFAWVGDVIRRGGQPYRDAWEMKGPFAYYSYALAQSLFGHNLWGVRLLDGLCLAAGALCFYNLASRIAGRFAAAWAGMVLVIWYGSGSYCYTAQPDVWAVMMIIGGTALAAAGKDAPSRVRWFCSGALIGCATDVKPLFGLFLVLPVLAALPRLGAYRRLITGAAWATVGFLAPATVVVLWFWRAGILHDYIEQHLIYSAAVYARDTGLSAASVIGGMARYALWSKALQVLAVPAALGAAFLVWRDWRRALLAAVWLAAALVCIALQNRYYPYHWAQVFPPVLLLAAAGIHGTLERLNSRGARICVIFFLAAVTAFACAPLRWDVLRWAGWIRGATSTAEYYKGFPVAYPEMQAAAYIRSQTNESERVAIWGFESPILFMASRSSASRFAHSAPFLAGPPNAWKEKYRKELLHSLKSAPPAFLVFGSHPGNVLGTKAGSLDFPGIRAFAVGACRPDRRFARLRLYRCRAGPGMRAAKTKDTRHPKDVNVLFTYWPK